MAMSIDSAGRGAVEVVSARTEEVSAEEPSASEDLRPEFTAESLSPRMRALLFVMTVIDVILVMAVAVAVLVWPRGLFDAGAAGAVAIGATVTLAWSLQLVFGALLENNRAVRRAAHTAWTAAFVLAGPVAMLFYWAIHVRSALYLPHREGEADTERAHRLGT